MEQGLQTMHPGYTGAVASAEQRNRVLRNTYWLLALSMVPTVLGAWIGVSTGLMLTMGAGMSAIVFLGGAFGFIFAIEKTKNSAAGVPVLLGFTFFMGLMLSRMLAVRARHVQRRRADHDGLRRHRPDLLRHGHALDDHQARPVDDGQVPVRRRDHADHRRHRQHLAAVERADDHGLGASRSASSRPSSSTTCNASSSATRATTSPPRSASTSASTTCSRRCSRSSASPAARD